MSQIPALLQRVLEQAPFDRLVESVKSHSFGPLEADISHHFSGGVYAKETHIPAGFMLLSHKHEFDHMSILASGHVQVRTESGSRVFVGPAVIEIKAGLHHAVHALVDSVWFCVHATDETDPEKVDKLLIQKEAA